MERGKMSCDEFVDGIGEWAVMVAVEESAAGLQHLARIAGQLLAQEIDVAFAGDVEGVVPRAGEGVLGVGEGGMTDGAGKQVDVVHCTILSLSYLAMLLYEYILQRIDKIISGWSDWSEDLLETILRDNVIFFEITYI